MSVPAPGDYQFCRAEALHAALNQILIIADQYISAREGTYHNAVMEIFAVTCRALNADAEMGPRYERVWVDGKRD